MNLSIKFLKSKGFKKCNHTDLILYKQLHEKLYLYLIQDEDDKTFKPLYGEYRMDSKVKSLTEFKNVLKKDKILTLEEKISIVELNKLLSFNYEDLLNYLDRKLQSELLVLHQRKEELLKKEKENGKDKKD